MLPSEKNAIKKQELIPGTDVRSMDIFLAPKDLAQKPILIIFFQNINRKLLPRKISSRLLNLSLLKASLFSS
jgi:hypothetical protein